MTEERDNLVGAVHWRWRQCPFQCVARRRHVSWVRCTEAALGKKKKEKKN